MIRLNPLCPPAYRAPLGVRFAARRSPTNHDALDRQPWYHLERRSWPDRLELQSAVFEYIEAFYNRQRRHCTLDMLSPANYEQLRLSRLGS
jgi:transposase InsO family protein